MHALQPRGPLYVLHGGGVRPGEGLPAGQRHRRSGKLFTPPPGAPRRKTKTWLGRQLVVVHSSLVSTVGAGAEGSCCHSFAWLADIGSFFFLSVFDTAPIPCCRYPFCFRLFDLLWYVGYYSHSRVAVTLSCLILINLSCSLLLPSLSVFRCFCPNCVFPPPPLRGLRCRSPLKLVRLMFFVYPNGKDMPENSKRGDPPEVVVSHHGTMCRTPGTHPDYCFFLSTSLHRSKPRS